jgi:hypothetical protein
MQLHHLPISASQRPRTVSLEAAEAALHEALSTHAEPQPKRDYFERKWAQLRATLSADDHLWLFETSGLGAHQRRGLARERLGRVLDILVFP